jgi:superfamily II DNA/RNA helicase
VSTFTVCQQCRCLFRQGPWRDVCSFLLQVRGDKIIVFSDNIFALREYAQRLRKPFIYGGTSHQERTRVLAAFKRSAEVSALVCSNTLYPPPLPALPYMILLCSFQVALW